MSNNNNVASVTEDQSLSFTLRHPFEVYVTSVFPRLQSCRARCPGLAHLRLAGPLCFSLKPLAATEPFGSFSTSEQPYNLAQLFIYCPFNWIYLIIGRRFQHTALTWELTQRIAGSAGHYNVFLRWNWLVENNGGGDSIFGAHKRRQPLCDLEPPVSVFMYFYIDIAIINSAICDNNQWGLHSDNLGGLIICFERLFWCFLSWWGMGNLSARLRAHSAWMPVCAWQ